MKCELENFKLPVMLSVLYRNNFSGEIPRHQTKVLEEYLPFRGTFSRRNKKSTLDILKNESTFFYKKPYFSHDALLFYI